MIKFEVIFSKETISEVEMAKDQYEKEANQGYISWERFIRACVLDVTYRTVAKGEKLNPRK